MKLMILFLWITVVSACASKQQKANLNNVTSNAQGINIISNHPEIINTYVKKQNVQSIYCLEPDPDITVGFGGSLSLDATADKTKETLSGSDKESLISSGGLSPMVLVVREMLYRACELSMNTNANQQQSMAIYQSFLKSIENLSKVFGQQTGTAPSQTAGQ